MLPLQPRVCGALRQPTARSCAAASARPQPLRARRQLPAAARGPCMPGAATSSRPRLVAQFKGQGTAEAPAAEEEYLRLEYDCTELLDLKGRDSFLFCDITKAYDTLMALPLTEGYSAEVVAGRCELLEYVKEQALLHEGRVQRDNRGIDLPVQLLPSALALLAQLNRNAAVNELATKLLDNWDMRKTYKRDLLLSLVVAHCNVARDLLTEQQVAEGCVVLEEGLALLRDAGEPPLAPGLAADLQDAVDGMAVQRILDQLRGERGPAAAQPRRKAVALLRELLSHGPGAAPGRRGALRGLLAAPDGVAAEAAAAAGGVTADYVRLVVDCMTAPEVVAMADWDAVVRRTGATHWLYPGLLHITATAHMATGFTERRPALVRTGLSLLKAVPASAEVLVLRGVACVLLGEPEAAVTAIKAAASAPADGFISWPSDPRAATRAPRAHNDEAEPDAPAVTLLPAPADAGAFLAVHSGPDEPELLSGLCLFTEAFLQKVVFAGFPDTERLDAASASLPAYFDSAQVQAALEQFKDDAAGIAGRAAAAMDAVRSVQPLVQRLAATASSTLDSLQARGGGGGGASGRPVLPARLAADLGHAGAEAWEQESDDDDEAPPARRRSPGGAVAGLLGRAAAAVNVLAGGRLAGALQGRARAAALAGGAVLAAALLAASLGRRGAVATPPQQQPLVAAQLAAVPGGEAAGVAAAAAAAARPLDKAGALALVKAFQAAKADALGSNFDASGLQAVCVGPALARFGGMSRDGAARGWFRTSKLWRCDVTRVAPASPSGLRLLVSARVGETAETWGIDGQRGHAWRSEYDVDYAVVLCRDMAWRIERVTVRGQEPGAPSWPGVRLLGGLLGGGGGGAGSS